MTTRRLFASISDPFMDHNAKSTIYKFDPQQLQPQSLLISTLLEIDIPKEHGKRVIPTNIPWTYLNEILVGQYGQWYDTAVSSRDGTYKNCGPMRRRSIGYN